MGTSRVEELTPAKSDMATAVGIFKQFFKTETGKDWEDKNDTKIPSPKTDDQGYVLPAHEDWYFCESHDNIFTSFLMQAGPSGGSTNSTISVDHRDAPGEPETGISRPEIVVSVVSAQSDEDSGNNADVDSDRTIADDRQPTKSEAAVDTEILED